MMRSATTFALLASGAAGMNIGNVGRLFEGEERTRGLMAQGVAKIRENLLREATERTNGRRRLNNDGTPCNTPPPACGLIPPDFEGISTDVGYADAHPIPADFYSKEPVGVLTAFLGEFTEAIAVMDGVYGVMDIASKRFVAGSLDGVDIVLVTTGIGMTNAATTVQSMFITWPAIEYVIFSGIAGGTSDKRKIADVVVPIFWLQPSSNKYVRPLMNADGDVTDAFYDFGVDFPTKFTVNKEDGSYYSFLRAVCDGCSVPATDADKAALESAGAATFDNMAVMIELQTFTTPIDAFQAVPPSGSFFYIPSEFLDIVNEVLVEIAEGTVSFVKNGTDPLTGDTLYFDPQLYIADSGISADTFLDNSDYRAQMYDTFGAECVDMETTSVVRTCIANGKKCMGIRSLSDLAGGEDSINNILSFISIAGKNSVVVLRAVLGKIPGASRSTCTAV